VILVFKYLAIAVVAYLLGAIPFGLIIGKRMAGVDIRQHGSGNIGATNVFRTLGTKPGLLTAARPGEGRAGGVAEHVDRRRRCFNSGRP